MITPPEINNAHNVTGGVLTERAPGAKPRVSQRDGDAVLQAMAGRCNEIRFTQQMERCLGERDTALGKVSAARMGARCRKNLAPQKHFPGRERAWNAGQHPEMNTGRSADRPYG